MPVSSLRVLDVNEVLLPGATSALHFPVHNPFNQPVTVTLVLQPLQPWVMFIDPSVLDNMRPQETRPVTLTVSVPAGAGMPPDGAPVADVEAFAGTDPQQWQPIGGLRKIYRPPVPIHRQAIRSTPRARSRCTPIRPASASQPRFASICATPPDEQSLAVDFNVAKFGIGLPWHSRTRTSACRRTAW